MIGLHMCDVKLFLHERDPGGQKRQRLLLDVPVLDVEPGEALAITGPSGGGKTTLLYVLAGLQPPAQGSVYWNDISLYKLPEFRRDALRAKHAGMVFQDFQLLGGLSALDNVLVPLTFRAWRMRVAERRRALDMLERLGVRHPHTRAEKLSRGEMQRVGLARAALGAGEGSLLLADEPTASLDADAAQDVARLLGELCREQGMTLLCVTHDALLMRQFSRRVRLENGRLADESFQDENQPACKTVNEAA